MKLYVLTAVLFRFVIELLLMMGVNQICFSARSVWRCLVASGVAGVYAWLCLLPGFSFLGNMLWYTVFLVLIGMVCFGMEKYALQPVALFVLFNLVLDSVITEQWGLWTGLLGLLALLVLCFWRMGGGLVPVQLVHQGKRISVMALRDTGNTLKDPVTGQPVLVIGAQVASALTGLTLEQLQNPVESMGLLPGLRLIPYRTVGHSGAMMLAMRLQQVQIGNWKGGGLVAFAPECLGKQGTYQALTGGTL